MHTSNHHRKKVGVYLFRYLLFCGLCFSMVSCEQKEFSEAYPFTLRAGKYRDFFHARAAMDRLKSMGLAPALVIANAPAEGTWHHVMVGNYQQLEEAMANRISLEDAHGLLKLEIVNYFKFHKQYAPVALEAEPVFPGPIGQKPAGVSIGLWDILPFFPGHNHYSINDMLFFAAHENADIARFAIFQQAAFDFPRGINPANLFKHLEAFGEVRYTDALLGGEQMVHVLKYQTENPFGDDIALYFADLIKSTRSYPMESMEPLTVEAYTQLAGYLVTLQPRAGVTALYLVLADTARQLLYFIQATNTPPGKLTDLARQFGKNYGLLSYPEINRCFYTLPEGRIMAENLVMVQVEQLQGVRGSLSLLLEGALQGKFLFYETEKGLWEYRMQWHNEPESARTAFDKTYAPRNKSEKDSLHLGFEKAWLTYDRRKMGGQRQLTNFPGEAQVLQGPFLAVVSNRKQAFLQQEDLQLFLEQLRLENPDKPLKKWFFF